MILLGGEQMWTELREWLKKWPVGLKLISDSDLSYLKICDTVEDAVDILDPEINKFYNKNL